MIEEAYCSNEVARLLKEKGFDEPCVRFSYQLKDRVKYGMDKDCPTNTDLKPIYTSVWSVPTYQMAMAWLREVHYLWIDIEPLTNHKWTWGIWFMNDPKLKMGESSQVISTYEEAVEASLTFVLENLI